MTKKLYLNLRLIKNKKVVFPGHGKHCLPVHKGGIVFRIYSLVLGALLVAGQLGVHAQNADFVWVNGMGGTGGDYSYGVAADANGNVYVTGSFAAAGADFNPGGSGGALTSAGGSDVFVAKYSPSGTFLWAKSMGGTGVDEGLGVATDANGNVYVTGYIGAAADFNPGGSGGMLTFAGTQDAFVAKYDSSGTFLWAKSMGGIGVDQGWGVAVDANGNVYVTGYFPFAGADFNPGGTGGTLASAGGTDAFVAKFDPTGTFLWVKRMGGTGNDRGQGVAAATNGNVYVTGYFAAAGADFNPGGSGGAFTSAGGNDVFVAKFDPTGTFLWAKSMGGTGADVGNGVAVDANDNVYVTGNFAVAGADFNAGGSGGALSSAGGTDVFVAKYSSTGTFLWAKSMGGIGGDAGEAVAVDANGNVCVTGYIGAAADFNAGGSGGAVTSAGGWDAFVAKYDSSGTFLWAKSMGGTGYDNGYGVAVDADGKVYVAGYFAAPGADFNPGGSGGALTVAGGADVFVVKFACNDTFPSYLTVKECGERYTLNGEVYTTSGIYTQHLPNSFGCDSTITLELIFVKPEAIITIEIDTLRTTEPYDTYQWLFNGQAINGATNSSYTVTQNGAYQVVVMDENGCTDTSEIYTVTNHGVGIEDIKNIGKLLLVYPNPFSDVIYINSPVAVNAVLTTLEGRAVYNVEHAISIPVKNLAEGVYFLRILDKENRLIKVAKMVKE